MISKLINKNKWSEILDKLKKNKINPDEIINNGNTIAHLAAANNDHHTIKYYLDKYPDILNRSNSDGDTVYHILAKYKYTDLLKFALKKSPESANLINNKGETVVHLLDSDWIIKNIKGLDLNSVDYKGSTSMIKAIREGDLKRVKLLLEKGYDINSPSDNPPIVEAVSNNKSKIAEYLIKKGADVNIKNSNYLTPLLIAVYNGMYSIVKRLIDAGADIDYRGAEGDYDPVLYSVFKNDSEMVDILLETGFDLNKHNRRMETTLHSVLSYKDRFDETKEGAKPPTLTDIAKLIYHGGDLNIQNIDGDTPLHLLLKNYKWRNFKKFLEKSKLDIFINNNSKKTPLSYVDSGSIPSFIETVTKSYINKMGKKCDKRCTARVKKHILEKKASYPNKEDYKFLKQEFKLIKSSKENSKGLFNSNTFHSMVYSTIVLERNRTVKIPTQIYIEDKATSEKMLLVTTNMYRLPETKIITELLKAYTQMFYEIAPYLILWRSSSSYYVHKDLELYTMPALLDNKVRFVFFKLTLISSSRGSHANIVIYDKHTGVLERFEPYGVIPYMENTKLDEMLQTRLEFLAKRTGKELVYLGPRETMGNISFQIVSNDSDPSVRKAGDPVGYCLAWTLWYLEMRVRNPDVAPKDLIKRSFEKIISGKEKNREELFINFIRRYANKLDQDKNKLFLEAGVSKDKLYNVVPSEEDQKRVIDILKKILSLARL